MITINKNSVTDKHLIVTVPYHPYYVLVLQDARGNKTAVNCACVNYSERFTRLLLIRQHVNSLRFGEYKYAVYHATSGNDITYNNKDVLETGILKVI